MIIGKQVYLRIIEESDIERTHKWINDPEINEIMGYLPVTLKQQEQWFKTTVGNSAKYVFAICLNETDEHIGNVGLGNIDYINRNAMFSIFIAENKFRGRGIGKEATKLALDFAFYRLNMHKVYLKVSDYLVDAVNLYKSAGFQEEGRFREHEFKSGKYIDKLFLSIFCSEYQKNKHL
jgi:RimJ/RimL family protein N-acetyltransferase